MEIIDAHMHFSDIEAFRQGAVDSGVDYSLTGLMREYADSGVTSCICMGISETAPGLTPDRSALTPMGTLADATNKRAAPIPMRVCLGINPHNMDDAALSRIAARLDSAPALFPAVAGFKIYAGYYHVHIFDERYMPVYKIASEYGLAVAIHSGETYFKGGLLKYSHPLHVDRLAHMFPDLKFVISHMGFPWAMDACAVATNNRNVYVDISGLAVGSEAECFKLQNEPLIRDYFRQGLVFMNNYKKVIFGTDWPLVPVQPYIDACKAIIPQDAWEDVFRSNAIEVYGRL